MNELPKRIALLAGALGLFVGIVVIAKIIVDGPDVKTVLAAVPYLGCAILAILGWRKEKGWMTLASAIWLVGTAALMASF